MAEDEFVTKVSVDYDGSGFDRYDKDSQEFAKSTADSGSATERATRSERERDGSLVKLANRLQRLAREQQEYEREVREGVKHDDAATDAAKRREQQLARINDAMARTSARQDQVNRSARQSGAAAGEVSKLTSALQGMLATIGGGVGAAQVIQIIGQSIARMNEHLRETAELADRAAKATIDLHALNLQFNPDDEAFITTMSTSTGRSMDEIGKSFTSFKSSTGFLSADQQRSLYRDVVGVMAMGTSGSIEPLAEFTAKASALESDPLKLRNALASFIREAGEGDPAKLLSGTLPLLQAGELSGANVTDTFALMALATRAGGSAESATQLRNIMLKFGGDEATKKQLAAMGVTGGDLFEKVNQLGARGLSSAEAVKLVGVENVAALNALVQRRDELGTIRASIGGAADSPTDIYGNFLNDLAEKSPRHNFAIKRAQADRRVEAIRASGTRGQQAELSKKIIEETLEVAFERDEISRSTVEAVSTTFDFLLSGGFSPGTAARMAQKWPIPVTFDTSKWNLNTLRAAHPASQLQMLLTENIPDLTEPVRKGLEEPFTTRMNENFVPQGTGPTVIIQEQNNYGTTDPHLVIPPNRGPR